jgi:hypothetical protein
VVSISSEVRKAGGEHGALRATRFIRCQRHRTKEEDLAKRAGAYRSEKRKKEITRQKKQEEKREKRFKKKEGEEKGPPVDEQGSQAADQQND